MNYHQMIEELKGIACDSLLNQEQKFQFIKSTVSEFFAGLEYDQIPAIQAAIRLAAEPARPITCKYCGISKAEADADYLLDDGRYPECGATGEDHHMGPYGQPAGGHP